MVFPDLFAGLQQQPGRPGADVAAGPLEWAEETHRGAFVKACRRLLLPGSHIAGFAEFAKLGELAQAKRSCLLCLNHRSNLDVPTLYTLLEDQAELDVFQRIVWIAGRKLSEDQGLTSLIARCFHRVVVTPHSWVQAQRSEDALREARRFNIAAARAILSLRRQGWIIGLFPAGTRLRPGDQNTARAIEETDSYLKKFDYLLLCNIEGCTLPVSRDWDLTRETPRLDRVVYTFGTVQETRRWRARALERFREHDQRRASALALMDELAALASPGAGET